MSQVKAVVEVVEKACEALEMVLDSPIEKATIDTSQVQTYSTVRREYRLAIYAAVVGYLDRGGRVTTWKNNARRAVTEHLPVVFYTGYAENGAEETEDEDERWLTARINEELGYLDDLFIGLREGRDEMDAEAQARERADGYANSLDGVYSEGLLRGAKNRMLEFDGDDGEENCNTCKGLKGKKKSIRWILENDMIPQPGNDNFICKGYKCLHFWKDSKTGERWTF
jgi:hypothetical protein